jgi:hypothetical protein
MTQGVAKSLTHSGSLISTVADKVRLSIDSETSSRSPTGRDGGVLFGCKAVRGNPGLAAIAFASFNDKATKSDKFYGGKNYTDLSPGDGRYDLTVVLARESDQKILGRYFGRGELESNAVLLDSVDIDPASYKLSITALTFGVRVRNTSRSSSYIAADDTLSLFSFKNGTLTKVLDKLSVNSDSGNLKHFCGASTDVDHVTRYVIVSKSETNGMRNLIVRAIKKNFAIPEGCEGVESETETETKIGDERQEYVFDGNIYVRKGL